MSLSSALAPVKNGYTATALVSANAATRLSLTPVPLLSAVAVYQERQQEHITELTNTVQDLKLEIVRLKESLSAVQTVAKAKSQAKLRVCDKRGKY